MSTELGRGVVVDIENEVYPETLVVPVAGPRGPMGPPGAGALRYEQSTPAAVWGPIEHGFGRQPAAVSLFSLDFGAQYGEFVVQHLDENTLRISMDTPTAGIALIS